MIQATERSVLSSEVATRGCELTASHQARAGENPAGCPVSIKVPEFNSREERTMARDRDLVIMFEELSNQGFSFNEAIKVCMAQFYLSRSTTERVVLYGYKRKYA